MNVLPRCNSMHVSEYLFTTERTPGNIPQKQNREYGNFTAYRRIMVFTVCSSRLPSTAENKYYCIPPKFLPRWFVTALSLKKNTVVFHYRHTYLPPDNSITGYRQNDYRRRLPFKNYRTKKYGLVLLPFSISLQGYALKKCTMFILFGTILKITKKVKQLKKI